MKKKKNRKRKKNFFYHNYKIMTYVDGYMDVFYGSKLLNAVRRGQINSCKYYVAELSFGRYNLLDSIEESFGEDDNRYVALIVWSFLSIQSIDVNYTDPQIHFGATPLAIALHKNYVAISTILANVTRFFSLSLFFPKLLLFFCLFEGNKNRFFWNNSSNKKAGRNNKKVHFFLCQIFEDKVKCLSVSFQLRLFWTYFSGRFNKLE